MTSTTGTISNLYSNILAVKNNNTQRATNDIFEACTSSTGNYIYYNNSSIFGHMNVTNSALSWFINSSGAATFPSVNNGVSSISTLAVGSSSVRGTGDLLTVSVTPTGNYIYLNNGGTFGAYNTNTSSFPWFIEMDGDSSFQSVNCYNLSVKNTKQQVTKTIRVFNLLKYPFTEKVKKKKKLGQS